MRKSFFKIIILILTVNLIWLGLRSIGKTFASFSDLEISEGNSFSAATLDFNLHSGQNNFVPESKSLNLKPGDKVNRVIQVRSEGSLSFQYTAWAEKISGDDDFCNILQLEADLEGKEVYNGSLMDFNFLPTEISDSIDTLHFKVSLPEGSNFQNKTCQINFVFEGWQTKFPDLSLGFFDREEIESRFATGSSGLTNEESLNNEDNQEEINSSQGLINEEPTENFLESELGEAGQEPVVEETPAVEASPVDNSTDSGENSSNTAAVSNIGNGGENTATGETSGSSDGLNSGGDSVNSGEGSE